MKKIIRKSIESALLKVKEANDWPDFVVPEIILDVPKNQQFGDYSTNIAMALAKTVGKPPVEIAKEIADAFDASEYVELVDVVMPGYINIHLSKQYLQNKVQQIISEGQNFGNSDFGKDVAVNNEFISANPTGPLHLGNGRGGFYGDSLSRLLRKAGFAVTNEYYINDAGEQVVKLGHSVLKDDQAVYTGEYIDELHEKFKDIGSVEDAGQKAASVIVEDIIKRTVSEKMNITFDEWMREKTLYEKRYVDQAIELLKDKGLTFENEGALWLKTTQFGDDKDRVLIKSDGNKTYFASDCGYILNKMQRGFHRLIETWGADHHGYIVRFTAAARALGFEGELKFIIVQLVRLMKDGKEVRMSKRAGNVIYIDDLIEEIGHDVARFFFLMYSPDSHMNFDLGLAKERSQKNPVYYVQYAHARICSILAKAKSMNFDQQEADLSLLNDEKELSLIKELSRFPEIVEDIAHTYEVHKLTHYAIKLADKFHSFYDACKVIDEENHPRSHARLNLINAVRITLSETLRLIGVQAPEKM